MMDGRVKVIDLEGDCRKLKECEILTFTRILFVPYYAKIRSIYTEKKLCQGSHSETLSHHPLIDMPLPKEGLMILPMIN